MPINPKYKAIYETGKYYHVFNKTNGSILLFRDNGNCQFFLRQLKKYLGAYLDVLAYCLLPNHFHLLVRIRETEEDVNELITNQFKKFFISYSLSYKNRFDIKQNIFAPKYKHVLIDSDNYLTQIILYIHRNPLHHNVFKDWKNYKWSSYEAICQKDKSLLKVNEVIDWFGGMDEFISFHEEGIDAFIKSNRDILEC